MTEEELQIICNRIQNGESHDDWFGVSQRVYKKRRYWHIVSIDNKLYSVNTNLKIITDVEL